MSATIACVLSLGLVPMLPAFAAGLAPQGGIVMSNGTAAAPASLEGRWRVTMIRDAIIPPGTVIEMTFADGRVQGLAGCSGFEATASAEGGDLNLGMIRYNSNECADAVMQAGADFVRALGMSGRYEVDAEGRLTLFSAMFPLIQAER